jgi:hypothetical protein
MDLTNRSTCAFYKLNLGIKGSFFLEELMNNVPLSFSVQETLIVQNSEITQTTQNLFSNNRDLERLINKLDRFLPIIQIGSNLIRYDLLLNNESFLKVSYKETLEEPEYKELVLETIFTCLGKKVPHKDSQILESDLYLGNRTEDDRDYIGKIISNCITNSSVAVENNLGKNIYIPENFTPNATGTINFIVRPDKKSILFILIGCFIAWSGFFILIREGIEKSLSRKRK